MSFKELYDEVQKIKGKIGVRALRDFAITFSTINRVKEQWSGELDSAFIEGFYIEGPLRPPIPLLENEALIVIGRAHAKNKHMRRFVYTKELMHVFDTPDEKTDSPEKLESLAERFRDPSAELTPQFRSETIAFWRAIAVLCQEERRKEFQSQLNGQTITLDVIAAALQVPPSCARHLFREDFPTILEHIM